MLTPWNPDPWPWPGIRWLSCQLWWISDFDCMHKVRLLRNIGKAVWGAIFQSCFLIASQHGRVCVCGLLGKCDCVVLMVYTRLPLRMKRLKILSLLQLLKVTSWMFQESLCLYHREPPALRTHVSQHSWEAVKLTMCGEMYFCWATTKESWDKLRGCRDIVIHFTCMWLPSTTTRFEIYDEWSFCFEDDCIVFPH